MRAILLAAGKGTRLRPLTATTPKPMILLAGRPIMEHNVRLMIASGIRDIVINLHYFPVKVMDHFGDGKSLGATIMYSYESDLLGTAGAVKRVADLFDETFLVLYADNVTMCDIGSLVDHHRKKGGIATIAAAESRQVKGLDRVVMDGEDRILQIGEKPEGGVRSQVDVRRETLFDAGVMVMEPEILRDVPETRPSDFVTDVFPAILKGNQALYGYRMKERHFWIDTPEDHARAEEEMRKGGAL